MKTKKLASKLTLNKKTIANVGKNEMPHIKGGVFTRTCQSDYGETCIISCFYTCDVCKPD